jgi:phage gp36-like protein
VPTPIYEYATVADLGRYGINEDALSDIDPADKLDAIVAASREADNYLADQYTLPLSAAGIVLTQKVAIIAAYNLLAVRGYNPELGGDATLEARKNDAIKWLSDVAAGRIVAGVTDSSTGSTPSAGAASSRPRVISSSSRGYSSRGLVGETVAWDSFSGPRGDGGGGFTGD